MRALLWARRLRALGLRALRLRALRLRASLAADRPFRRLSFRDALDALLPREDFCCRAELSEAHYMGCRLEAAKARLAEEAAAGAPTLISRESKLDNLLAAAALQGRNTAELLHLARQSDRYLQLLTTAEADKAERAFIAGSVAELAAATGLEVQDDYLVCKACEMCNKTKSGGVFKQRQKLKALKHSVKAHLASQGHVRARRLYGLRCDQAARRRAAGLNCARAALLGYKEAASFLSYPRRIQFLHLSGCEVGDLNHSE